MKQLFDEMCGASLATIKYENFLDAAPMLHTHYNGLKVIGDGVV